MNILYRVFQIRIKGGSCLAILNKGESRHALARAIFLHQLGELRNLVVKALIMWNTIYLSRAIIISAAWAFPSVPICPGLSTGRHQSDISFVIDLLRQPLIASQDVIHHVLVEDSVIDHSLHAQLHAMILCLIEPPASRF